VVVLRVSFLLLVACSRSSAPEVETTVVNEPLWLLGRGGSLVRMTGELQQQASFDESTTALTRFDGFLAWSVGVGRIWHTSDGGESWTAQVVPVRDGLTSISFSSPSHGIAVGERGTVLTTEDGGGHWRWHQAPRVVDLRSVKLARSTGAAVAVGEQGTLLRSGDSGRTWTVTALPSTEALLAADMTADGSLALVAGRNGRAYLVQGEAVLALPQGKTDWLAARFWRNSIVLVGQGGVAQICVIATRECRSIAGGAEDFISIATHPSLLILGRYGTLYRVTDGMVEPMAAIADAIGLDDL